MSLKANATTPETEVNIEELRIGDNALTSLRRDLTDQIYRPSESVNA
jgi:hypothetical protein